MDDNFCLGSPSKLINGHFKEQSHLLVLLQENCSLVDVEICSGECDPSGLRFYFSVLGVQHH